MSLDRSQTSRLVLSLLAQGVDPDGIVEAHPTLTRADIASAAEEALEALRATGAPRVETRAERIERHRRTHPRAYEPWTEEEDARLLYRHSEGLAVTELSRVLGRQPNAIRARLDRWLGDGWRKRQDHSETNLRP